jgi:hypothetical protein
MQATGAEVPLTIGLVAATVAAPDQRYEHPCTHRLCCLINVTLNIPVAVGGWGMGALDTSVTYTSKCA